MYKNWDSHVRPSKPTPCALRSSVYSLRIYKEFVIFIHSVSKKYLFSVMALNISDYAIKLKKPILHTRNARFEIMKNQNVFTIAYTAVLT